MEKKTIGLQQFKALLGWNKLNTLPISPEKEIDFFKPKNTCNDKYVSPFLKVIDGDTKSSPRIVLISAAGAVGKSQLTRHLSYEKTIPVFDLAECKPVGDYTMTGVLSELYDQAELKKRFNNGEQVVIIDALDEGKMKVTFDAFMSFIDDVAKHIPANSDTIPFIMMGRTNIMELVYLHLAEKGINSLLLQIEPFKLEQAREYIDIHVIGKDMSKRTPAYIEIRDYIIESLEGFFKREHDSDHSSYENFIGYAPVLDAISNLLSEQTNYQKLLNSLKDSNATNVDLLIDIIECILDREKNDKVYPNMVKKLAESYSSEIQEQAKEKCYSIEEQCYRLLAHAFGCDETYCEIDDATFGAEYEKGLAEFFAEHPFIGEKSFKNVVYESFAIAVVATMDNPDKRLLAEMYVEEKFKDSFAFYPIMYKVIKNKEFTLPSSYFPPLYESLISQSQDMLRTEIVITEKAGNVISVDLENENEKIDHTLEFEIDNSSFNIGGTLANADINLSSMNIEISKDNIVLRSPISITCKSIECSSDEIVLVGVGDQKDVTFACAAISIRTTHSGSITKISSNGAEFKCISPSRLSHPFSGFHIKEEISKEDPNYEKYHKLRAIITQFRAHKKGGDWAKKKDKLYRRYSRGVGKRTLNELLRLGIIYPEGHLYKLNQEKMREHLAITYTDMQQCKITEKVSSFLNSY